MKECVSNTSVPNMYITARFAKRPKFLCGYFKVLCKNKLNSATKIWIEFWIPRCKELVQ